MTTKKVVWRILQENIETHERRYVATYGTKKQAQVICDGFNNLGKAKDIHTVVREEITWIRSLH